MNLKKIALYILLTFALPVLAQKESSQKEPQTVNKAETKKESTNKDVAKSATAKTDAANTDATKSDKGNKDASTPDDVANAETQNAFEEPMDTAKADPAKAKAKAPFFKNLGTHQEHSIATNSSLAQLFFNQGLILFYGFEWGESIRSFREATRLDPECAMCYWGLALALGSKANAPMNGHEYSDAKAAAEKAKRLAANGPVAETDYTNALVLRFQHEPKLASPGMFSCHTTGAMLDASNAKELIAYSDAMQKLVMQYPRDADAKALYAIALFDAIDWKFWDAEGRINTLTPSVKAALDAALAMNKRHVGANHYYIHVLEQSPQPENAMVNADRLKSLVPGGEHLLHMPTHIYFLTGRYHEGSEANQNAIAAYKNYAQACKNQGFEPEVTYLYHHNFDFLRTTATMEGRKQLALSAAKDLTANLPATWLEANSDLQGFIPVPYFVKARFGMWQELLKEPKPKDQYQYAVGMWHYAQGLALARTGNLPAAEDSAKQLYKIIANGPAPDSLGKSGNQLLTIAYQVLSASIADLHHDEGSTINHLKTALKVQHDMGYHEPPDWYFPLNQALGDAYLKWGHPYEAINMYDQVLRKYPKNGWALFGIVQSLRDLKAMDKAKQVESQFKKAWQYADIKEPLSLFPQEAQ